MGEVVLVSGRDPRVVGGLETFVIADGLALQAAGYEPQVFCVGRSAETVALPFGLVHRSRTPAPVMRSTVSVWHRRWIVPQIVRFLAERPGPHVIHGYGLWTDTAVQASRALAKRGVEAIPVATAFVAIEHEAAGKLGSGIVRASARLRLARRIEVEWVRRVMVPVERRAYRSCKVVRVNYESVRTLLEQAHGTTIEIRKVPYASHTAFDAETPHAPPLPDPLAGFGDPAAPLIVSVSRHDPRKGLDVLIRALALMRDAGIPFRACLVGPGALLDEHRKLARQLGLGGQVAIPGEVPHVMPYLRNADVYVLPSLEEGSGAFSVLEALQAGVAIVTSGIDGLPEDLEDGANALFVPADDGPALQAAITRLIDEPALRERLGAAARRRYEERFSAARMIAEIGAFYAELGVAPKR